MQSEIKKHNNFGWKKLAYDAISMVFKKDLVAQRGIFNESRVALTFSSVCGFEQRSITLNNVINSKPSVNDDIIHTDSKANRT